MALLVACGAGTRPNNKQIQGLFTNGPKSLPSAAIPPLHSLVRCIPRSYWHTWMAAAFIRRVKSCHNCNRCLTFDPIDHTTSHDALTRPHYLTTKSGCCSPLHIHILRISGNDFHFRADIHKHVFVLAGSVVPIPCWWGGLFLQLGCRYL